MRSKLLIERKQFQKLFSVLYIEAGEDTHAAFISLQNECYSSELTSEAGISPAEEMWQLPRQQPAAASEVLLGVPSWLEQLDQPAGGS